MNTKNKKKPCFPEYSTGDGNAVAEALGNWGLSNCKTNPDHANIRRLKDIFLQMDQLQTPRRNIQVKYNRKYDPESWFVSPSPRKCMPSWTFAENRPLITFSSAVNRIPVFSLKNVRNELRNPAPGREYYEQGSDKWYKGEPMGCCYQATCCAPTTTGHCCTRPTFRNAPLP